MSSIRTKLFPNADDLPMCGVKCLLSQNLGDLGIFYFIGNLISDQSNQELQFLTSSGLSVSKREMK